MTFIIIIVIVFVIALLYFIHHDKLVFINQKIFTIEEKLKSTLIKRKEILKDAEKEIKELVKTDKEVFSNLQEIDSKKLNMFELDKKLIVYKKEFSLVTDKYDVLKTNEEFQKLSFAISETSDKLETYRKYYNKYAEEYNKVIKSFPIIITTIFTGRKQKEFFDI